MKSKMMKSRTSDESNYVSCEGLSSSIQYYGAIDRSDDHVMASGSDSSTDSKTRVYGLPLHRAVVVVANAALGAGMLNFPQAYERTGGLVNALTFQMVSCGDTSMRVGGGGG